MLKKTAYAVVLWLIRLWKKFTWLVIGNDTVNNLLETWFSKHFLACDVQIFKEKDHSGKFEGKGGKMRPWDIRVYNRQLYSRLYQDGRLGLGEAYMEGWWDCESLDQLFFKLNIGGFFTTTRNPWARLVNYLEFHAFNLPNVYGVAQVGEKHYDLGNELYESFLDPSMSYSCGYWANGAKDLTEAQQEKMELIGRKMKLKPGMRVLDIGCGYGALAKHLAETYKVTVVACTNSQEQVKFATERLAGVPRVSIRCSDYRDILEKFDRIVAIELVEYVGHHGLREFFKQTYDMLTDGGFLVVQSTGLESPAVPRVDPWLKKYIFPDVMFPRPSHFTRDTRGLFTIEEWENWTTDYDTTIMKWHSNFVQNWPHIKHLFLEDSAKFYRMWTYDGLTAAGDYRARQLHLWNIVLAKNTVQ